MLWRAQVEGLKVEVVGVEGAVAVRQLHALEALCGRFQYGVLLRRGREILTVGPHVAIPLGTACVLSQLSAFTEKQWPLGGAHGVIRYWLQNAVDVEL